MRATGTGPLLRDVNTGDVFAFLSVIRKQRTAMTANLYRKILSSFFVRCVKNGILTSNPVWPVKKFKGSKSEMTNRRAYTLSELSSMYSKAPNDFWRYMILGGFYAGFRMGDLVLMKHGNIDLPANVIRLETGKTGKQMNVPIAAPLRTVLTQLIGNGHKSADWLWPEQASLYGRQGAKAFSSEFYDSILTPCGLVPARENKKAAVWLGLCEQLGYASNDFCKDILFQLNIGKTGWSLFNKNRAKYITNPGSIEFDTWLIECWPLVCDYGWSYADLQIVAQQYFTRKEEVKWSDSADALKDRCVKLRLWRELGLMGGKLVGN
jgi:hypothetical protein